MKPTKPELTATAASPEVSAPKFIDEQLLVTQPIATPRLRPTPAKSITVAEGFDGRVDKLIAEHYPDLGRKRLGELFADGLVRINGKLGKKGDFVTPGDVVDLKVLPLPRSDETPVADESAAARLSVLLVHNDFIVVNKPTHMPSQPLRAGEVGTAANGVAHLYPECAAIGDDKRDGGLVHRLDIGTSGALLVARNESAYRTLRDLFSSSQMHKEYLAVVRGRLGANDCAAPLTQRGDHVVADFVEGLSAYTEFTVLKTSGEYSLVRCVARSGRMHQIRAHVALTGAPIIGDALYGGTPYPGFDGFFLHAEILSFGYGDEKIRVVAPLPGPSAKAISDLNLQ
jgi:23S rRNA pseudouridine1911/1915/1917 synthase